MRRGPARLALPLLALALSAAALVLALRPCPAPGPAARAPAGRVAQRPPFAALGAIRAITRYQDADDFPQGPVFASQMGCKCDANFAVAGSGTDDSAALQSLLNRFRWVVIDKPMKVHDVQVPSGCTLEGLGGGSYDGVTFPPAGLMQAPNTVCVLRNVNWVSAYNGGSPVTDWSKVVDHDVIVRNLFVHGNKGTGGASNACGGNANGTTINGADAYANPSLMRIAPCQFYGVRNLRVQNVFVYDPCTEAVSGGYLDGFLWKDVISVSPYVFSNRNSPASIIQANIPPGAPGRLKVRGMCRGGLIDGGGGYSAITGHVGVAPDDAVGIEGSAYFAALYPGPVTDVEVRGMRFGLCRGFAAVFGGRSESGGFSSLVDNVWFHHCSGNSFEFLIAISGSVGLAGTYGNVTFSDLAGTITSGTGSAHVLDSKGTIARTATFARIRATVQNANGFNTANSKAFLFFHNAARIAGANVNPQNTVVFDDIEVHDQATSTDYDVIQCSGSPDGWRQLKLRKVSVYRGGPFGVSAALAAGGSLTSAQPYFYVVTATSTNGESHRSAEVTATPSGGNLSVALTWVPVPGATGYKVYRATSSQGYSTPALVTTVAGGGTPGVNVTFTDTGGAAAAGAPPALNGCVLHLAASCTPASVKLEDVTADGLLNVAILDSVPPSGGWQTQHLFHRTPGIGTAPSVSVSTGLTLDRPVSDNTQSAKLYGGAGTVTNKKSDLSEDS